jgi:aryl-alcohol dehydrogenase-like predicted oxidoreductase
MESLVDRGNCRAIGLSDITLNQLSSIYESARIKPAVIQVESHPYLPETELLEFCKKKKIVLLAFAPLGHGIVPGPLDDRIISAIAARVRKTPNASSGRAGISKFSFARAAVLGCGKQSSAALDRPCQQHLRQTKSVVLRLDTGSTRW